MRTLVAASEEEAGHWAARHICATLGALIARNPGRKLVWVASTGRTPLRTYALLRDRYRSEVDWRQVILVQMDDYVDIHPRLAVDLGRELEEQLAAPLGLGGFIRFRPPPAFRLVDPSRYCATVERLGGIDLALHGLGRNGHLGFNEPGSAPLCPTRVVRLTESTREANFLGSLDLAPRYGITLGLATLGAARQTLLLATGSSKAPAVAKLLGEAPVDQLPAAVLRHLPNCLVILDRQAASSVASRAFAPREAK